MNTYILACDGGCSPNPGDGASAFILQRYADDILQEEQAISLSQPDTTNNQAELAAVVAGLTAAAGVINMEGPGRILLLTDSNNTIQWCTGGFKINVPEIQECVDLINEIITTFHLQVSWKHVRGHQVVITSREIDLNARCDAMCTALIRARQRAPGG